MEQVALVARFVVRREAEASFREFERTAARAMEDHGGRILEVVEVVDREAPDRYTEFHVVTFPSSHALLEYRRDPRVTAAMPLREASVIEIEIQAGRRGEDYHRSAARGGEASTRPAEAAGAPAPRPESAACRIRPFRLADEDAVIALWERCDLLRPWNDPHKDIRRKLGTQADLFLVAELDGRIVGTVMAGYDGHRGAVNYVGVDPAVRGRGIGRLLMEAVEQQLLARKCPKVNLKVRRENRPAVRFYEAIGYRDDDVLSFGKRLIPDEPGASMPGARTRAGEADRATVEVDAATAHRANPAETLGPRRDSVVTLREITADTVRAITQLAVAPGQERFVASNAVSLAQALFEPRAWYRGIYADETPVGFVMLHDDRDTPTYYLWRFMIDARYQRFGYGRRALEALVEHVRTLPRATEFLLSVVEGDGGPRAFYESCGFVSTDRYEEGELVLSRRL